MRYMTEAILLAVRNWGEADKMAIFLAKEKGKRTAIAYGCRRPHSRLAGGIQPFNHVELNVMSGRRVDTIRDCQILTPFQALREDLERMAYAAFVAEIIAEFCPEEHPETAIYELCLASFTALERRNPRLMALATACKLSSLAGYRPECESCTVCGQKRGGADGFFSFAHGGFCCRQCHQEEDLSLDAGMITFIKNMLAFDWQNPQPFKVSGASLMKTEKLFLTYLQYILEKPIKSLDFIGQLAPLLKRGQT